MPAPVVGGLLNFMKTQLQVAVFDGEIPRWDTQGNPINPIPNPATFPPNFPVVRCLMTDEGLTRYWTMADPYKDVGPILVQVIGTGRQQVEEYIGNIEQLFAPAPNWAQIPLPGAEDMGNPYYVISMLLIRWTCVMEEEVRLQDGQYCYRGDMHYEVSIHGAINTQISTVTP